MRMERIQNALEKKKIPYQYTEEDGLGSFDFEFRGLRYHIWEFCQEDGYGVDTNIRHAGRSEDIEGEYDKELEEYILGWPDMA